MVDHHLYSVTPLQELSIDTLGLLPKDEYGMLYIILIVDNFVGLYPAKTISTFEFVKVLSWVRIFGVPKVLRSDGSAVFGSVSANQVISGHM